MDEQLPAPPSGVLQLLYPPEAIRSKRPARDNVQRFPASSANGVQRTDLSVVIRVQKFRKVFTILAGSFGVGGGGMSRIRVCAGMSS